MTDSERITEVLKFVGMTANRFSEHIGLKTAQNIYDIIKGKHGISKLVAEKITAKYLNINQAWLLTGEGTMLKSEGSNMLPPIEKKRLIEIGAEVFEKKLNELFQSGIIVPASVVAEKDAKINELYREIGKLEAKIEELESKKDNAQMDENAECAVAK